MATGAAAFVSLSVMVQHESSPTRIASYVVSGIGFLGAGVIMREGFNVRGLNTAATLWCSAAAGVLTGWGFVAHAGVITLVVISCNLLLRPLARLIDRQPLDEASEVEVSYLLEASCYETEETHVRNQLMQQLGRAGLLLKSLSSEDINGTKKVLVRSELVTTGRNDKLVEQVTSFMGIVTGVTAVSWKIIEPLEG